MVENESAPRIGAAERAAAQRTLEAHLNSGRLSVAEYAERSAAAAEAVAAAELTVLFADLPAPHPPLSGTSPFGRRRGRGLLAAAAALVVVVVALVVGIALGRGAGSSPTAPTALAPTTANEPAGQAAGSSAPDTDGGPAYLTTAPRPTADPLYLPKAMLGTWRGIVTRGSQKFPLTMTLTGGTAGAVVGQSVFPTADSCTESLTLLSGGDDVIVAEHDPTGRCSDDQVHLTLTDATTMSWVIGAADNPDSAATLVKQ